MADEDWAAASRSSGASSTTATSAPSGDDAWAAALAPTKRDTPASAPSGGITPSSGGFFGAHDVEGKVAKPTTGHGTQVARTLGAIYAPLSPTGPVAGAWLQDAQAHPGGMLMAPMLGEHMLGLTKGVSDTFAADKTPHGAIKAIEDAQEKYGVTSGEGLHEERRLGGPVGSVADYALHHPRQTGVATGLAELFNPTGELGGALKAGLGPLARAMKLPQAAAKVADVGKAAAAPFDRYAGVRAGAGPEGENLAHTMESRLHGSENAATEHVVNAFGDPNATATGLRDAFTKMDPDRMVQGLTREEQIEVQNRAYQLPENSPYTAHVPNRALDASVLKRTGRSIDDRAAGLRAYQNDVDHRMVASGVMPAEDLYESGTYAPMKQYRDRPVFSEDFLNKNPEARDGTVPLSAIDSPKNVTPRGGFGVSRAFARGTKTQPPNYLLPEGALDEQYLPAHQILEHYGAAERAIAQAEALKLAERTKVPNLANPELDAQAARVPIQYNRRVIGGAIEDLGEGVEGRNAATNLVNRQRAYDAKMQAVNEIAPDLAGRRSPFKSALYLQGLGRGAAARGTDLEAANKAINPQRIAGAVNYDKMAAGLDDFQQRLIKANDAVGDSVRENGALREALATGTQAQRAAAKDVLNELGQMREAIEAQRPGNVRNVADEMRSGAANAQQPYWDALRQVGGKIVPDLVWDQAKKRFTLAGEFANVPKGLLASRKSMELPPIGQRAPGNIDEITDIVRQTHPNITDSDVREFFAANPRPPATSAFTDEARQRIVSEILPKYRNAGADQIEALRNDLRNARTDAKVAAGRERGARDATQSLAGPIANLRTTIGRGTGAAGPLADTAGKLRNAQGDVVSAVERGKDKITARGDQVRVELDELADKLLKAKGDEKLRLQIEQRASQILRNHVQTVSEQVDEQWGNLPKGYVRESKVGDHGLGAVDSNAYGIHKELGELLAEPLTDPRGQNAPEKFSAFMRGLMTLNNLTRTTIISMPTVHVIGNLGANFLAKYKDFGAFGRIMAGKGRPNEAQVQWLRDSGHMPGDMGNLQGVYKKGNAETLTRNRAELGRAQAVDQYVSQKYWAPNQKLVFGWYEAHYAWEAAKKEMGRTPEGRAELSSLTVGPEAMKSARNARKVLGDYRNISGFEKKLGLDRLMYFYPWLKTAVSFWTKQGILDPKSTIVAPERGIQANNEVEGYDDPNQPWTATMGRESDGSFRRTTMPYAGRITEDIGRTLALPVDVVNYFLNGDVDTLKTDLKSPFKMIKNRLNPFGQAIAAGMENVSGVQRKGAAKPTTAGERLGGAVNAAATEMVGPLGRVEQIPDDPAGALSSLAGGGFSYAQPVNITRAELAKFKAGAAQLRAQGQDQEADAIEQRLREIQGAP